MKRNDIYKELIGIREELKNQLATDSPRLNHLIDEIDKDRHLTYDQFECMQDVIQRFEKVKDQITVIEKDIEWVKSGNFIKPWSDK